MKTHYTFTLFIALSLILNSYIGFGQCNYSIVLYDSFNDGWNNGKVTVFVNGSAVLTDITLTDGGGPETFSFPVNAGDDITTDYTAGQWSNENSYEILDSDGFVVAEQGSSGAPGDITSGTITAVCPPCPAPVDLNVTNIGDTSVNLNWTETGSATQWTIKWGPVGSANNIIANITDNPYTLGSLSAASTYEFYVRSDCAGDSSSWNGPFSFTTASCDVSEQCSYTLDMDDTGNSWNGANIEVIQDGISLGTFTVSSGGSNTEIITLCNGSNIELIWTPGSYDNETVFSLLDSYNVSIYSWNSGNAPSSGTFHSFTASCEPVTCPQPISLNASNITDNSAELSWIEYADANQWNIEWGVEGFSLGSGTPISVHTNTNHTLNMLNQNTSYSFYVQSDCGSEQSLWSGPYTFETPLNNPSDCGLNMPIPDGNGNCLDVFINVDNLWGEALGTDVTVDKFNIIIDHDDVSDLSFSLTSPNQVTVPISYWNGTGSNYGIIDGTCTQYASFSMAGPDGDCNSATAPFLGEYIPEQTFNNWYDGSNPNGQWRLRICDSGGGPVGELEYVEIEFNDANPPTDVVINEIDVDQYSDTLEFIELYDGGYGNVSLNNFTLALYNGSSNQIYSVFDLHGYSTDANGYFVIGNAAVPSVDLVFNNGLLQDGADAVALYTDEATNLPIGTSVTLTNLSDAIVYGTDDAPDADLLPLLNAGQEQFNENELGNKKEHSCARLPNGSGGLRNTDSFSAAMPTPGAENIGVPEIIYNETTFTESISNDGSIENTISLELENNDFSMIGILTDATHYNASNVPSGLSISIETLSDSTAAVNLTGNASSHIESDDISNLNITFLDAAFNTYNADLVFNVSKDLAVDFFDTPPATMLWSAYTFFEDNLADDGSINTSIEVELVSETFDITSGNLYDFSFNNVPSGLYIDIQVIDNTHASITLTGNAASHLDVDDINNLEITFTDGAFSGGNAASVNGYTQTEMAVDFYQFYNDETDFTSFSFSEETGPAVINYVDHTIDIWVAAGTNISNLIADFSLSTGATAYIGTELQVSGITANNFSSHVIYDVMAENGIDTQEWIIGVDISTSIEDLNSDVDIYPNPASDFIIIDLKEASHKTCEVFTITGKLIKQVQLENTKTSISTQNWDQGIYWIRIISDGEIINKKIMIE